LADNLTAALVLAQKHIHVEHIKSLVSVGAAAIMILGTLAEIIYVGIGCCRFVAETVKVGPIAAKDVAYYRIVYHVPVAKVHYLLQPKPHGCDFDRPPFGNKRCHYEKQAFVRREAKFQLFPSGTFVHFVAERSWAKEVWLACRKMIDP
jgi:hypothetical protein